MTGLSDTIWRRFMSQVTRLNDRGGHPLHYLEHIIHAHCRKGSAPSPMRRFEWRRPKVEPVLMCTCVAEAGAVRTSRTQRRKPDERNKLEV